MFSDSVRVGNAAEAEILAIQKACKLCVSKNELRSREIVIESDSREVVLWITSGDFGNLALVDEIFEVRAILSASTKWSVCYVPRALNAMADGLAKRGSLLEEEEVEWFEL